MPTTCAVPLMSRPTAVAGAIHERTVPGVPRLAIQPQPSPDTKERSAITASGDQARPHDERASRRQSAAGPAQSHAT